MNEKMKSRLEQVVGQTESAFGKAAGDAGLEARGSARQLHGQLHDVAASVQEATAGVADTAKAVVFSVAERAQKARDRVTDKSSQVVETANGFVKEQPYVALALATVFGLVAGLIFAGGGSKVITIRPAPERES